MARLLITDGAHPLSEELADQLCAAGHEVYIAPKPAAAPEDVIGWLDRFGVPDGLIVSTYDPVRESLDGGDADILAGAVLGGIEQTYLALKHVGTAMADRGGGRVIFLSSIFADKPTGSAPSYSITQGALQMMMKELALLYGHWGLTVNTIKLAPAEAEDPTFDSELVQAAYDTPSKVPTGLRVTARDAAGAIGYFMSDAARNVNGADLRIDGGLLYHYMDRTFDRAKGGDA